MRLLVLLLLLAPLSATAQTIVPGKLNMHRQSLEEKERLSAKQKPDSEKPKAEQDRLERAKQLRDQAR